jgi:hypothetical protein
MFEIRQENEFLARYLDSAPGDPAKYLSEV